MQIKMQNNEGILFFGQSLELAGRGISGARLRTAAQRAGYNVKIIDYVGDLTTEQILTVIDLSFTSTTKFIGFSTSWIENANLKEFAWHNETFFNEIKKRYPKLLIITGGHDELNRNLLMKFSNYHFHGYSDNTFVEFLKMINGKWNHSLVITDNKHLGSAGRFIDSNKTNPVVHPDEIETVFESADNFESYQPVPIEISRGCIFRCGFCRHPFQGKKDYDSYQRTPESIARELKRNYDLFGTTRYTIMDDTFNDSIEKMDRLKRALDIAKLPKFEFVAYIRPELLVTKPKMIPLLGELGLRGAFFGIESFNMEARKAIGKGVNIEKVLDAAHAMADYNNNQILIHASFIVGLPHESPDDIYRTQQYMISNDSPFRSWIWQTLGIRNDGITVSDSQSTFDKNFEEYGYQIPLNSNQWQNEYFTVNTATELTNNLNVKSLPFQKYAGWRVAGAWHINKSHEQIQNEIVDTALFRKDLKKLSADRVKIELERLANE
jgi:radical SAM superfamily enzyme YgiQ (UPF0313 family)